MSFNQNMNDINGSNYNSCQSKALTKNNFMNNYNNIQNINNDSIE